MEFLYALSDTLTSQMGFLAILLFLFFFFIVLLHNIYIGMVLLIFSIPLSPEITGIFGSEIPVRIDDILIIMLFCVWIMKMGRGEIEVYRNPFTAPIIAMFSFMLFTTLIGYGYKHTIWNPKYSALVILKNFEYFAVFFLVANTIYTKKQIQNSFRLWMLAYFLVIIYGIVEHIIKYPGRLYDSGWLYTDQSNHMGGYLMISTTIAIALLLTARNWRLKMCYFLLIILSLYPFFYNQSKESYLSFCTSLFMIFLILKPRLLIVPATFILVLFFAIPQLFPHVEPTRSIEIVKEDAFVMKVDERNPTSADARRRIIAYTFQDLPEHPFIGHGVGYKNMAWYDSQIPLVFYEGGIVGAVIFMWLMLRIFVNGFRIFLDSKDIYFKTLAAAFVASFFGILVQSIPSPAWMVTLVIEPFWFFAGAMVAIDRLNKKERHAGAR